MTDDNINQSIAVIDVLISTGGQSMKNLLAHFSEDDVEVIRHTVDNLESRGIVCRLRKSNLYFYAIVDKPKAYAFGLRIEDKQLNINKFKYREYQNE